MTISAKRIRYSFGETTTWATKALTEGLPAMDHFDFSPVTDSTSGSQSAKGTPGTEADAFLIGTVYWTAEPRIRATPAHLAKILDNYFEDAVVGGASNYTRDWLLGDVPDEPSKYVCLAKNTSKTGHDYVESAYKGILTGFTIQGAEGGVYEVTPRFAFAGFDPALTGVGSGSAWEIDDTGADDPIKFAGTTVYAIIPVVGTKTLKVTSIRVSCSHSFYPHYYLEQTPDRWTRGKPVVDGEILFRDVTDEIEDLRQAFKDSTVIQIVIILPGSNSILINGKITTPVAVEDDITRKGKINFIGVEDPDATSTSPIKLTLYAPLIP